MSSPMCRREAQPTLSKSPQQSTVKHTSLPQNAAVKVLTPWRCIRNKHAHNKESTLHYPPQPTKTPSTHSSTLQKFGEDPRGRARARRSSDHVQAEFFIDGNSISGPVRLVSRCAVGTMLRMRSAALLVALASGEIRAQGGLRFNEPTSPLAAATHCDLLIPGSLRKYSGCCWVWGWTMGDSPAGADADTVSADLPRC